MVRIIHVLILTNTVNQCLDLRACKNLNEEILKNETERQYQMEVQLNLQLPEEN